MAAVDARVQQIARNAIVNQYRRAVMRREPPSRIEPRRELPAEAEASAGDPGGDVAACGGPLLARFSPAHRQALKLTEPGGLTQRAARPVCHRASPPSSASASFACPTETLRRDGCFRGDASVPRSSRALSPWTEAVA
jgi:hypothetical protein